MRVVIQRVKCANVEVDQTFISSIEKGLLILVGFEQDESIEDMEWLSSKILALRIFNDENELMNRSIQDVQGDILLISQFTLFASVKKGNRPSFIKSAKAEIARTLYDQFISILEKQFNKKISTGIFGADMKVSLINDGPVTIIIDSKNKE